MKKVIAIVLAVILLISSILIFPIRRDDGLMALLPYIHEVHASERNFNTVSALNYASPTVALPPTSDVLSNAVPRDGYILAPTIVGLTGIDAASSFILRTPASYGNSVPHISIDGQPAPIITREDDNTFIITPSVLLTSNSVYVFRLSRGVGEGGLQYEGRELADITWAFQTTVRFEIVSTLPRNQATNVPVNTGIEVNFSFGDAPDIENHFSIYPNAAGRFISRDSTAIFMPIDPLVHGQIYTVTIRAGVNLPNTSEVITTDRVFSFETAPAHTDESTDWSPSVHFPNRYVEFPTFAAPSVNFWLNYNRDRPRPTIQMNLYRIEDRAQAIAAVGRLASAPRWSRIAHADRFVDTSGLRRISSSQVRVRQDERRWNETFELPNNLAPGFYVLNAIAEDTNNQVIIQITDLAVQVIADNNMALVWVNDMQTGQPTGARVYDPISGTAYETSEYGIAVIERSFSSGQYMIITAADGRESVVFVHSSAFQSFRRWWGWDWDMPEMSHCCCDGGWMPSPQPSNNYY